MNNSYLLSFFKKYILFNREYETTVIKNIFWNFIGNVYKSGIMFLMAIALARLLGTEQYGVYTFATGFVAIFAAILDFGFSTVVLRDLSVDKSKTESLMGNLISIRLISGFLMLLVLFIASLFVEKSSQTIYVIYLLALYVIADSFNGIFGVLFLARGKMQYDAAAKIITSTLLFVSTFVVLYLTHSVVLASLTMVICSIVSVFIYWMIGNKYFNKIKLLLSKEIIMYLLKESYIFGLSGFLGLINLNFVNVVLGFFVSNSDIGGFGAIFKIWMIVVFMSTMILYPVFPTLSKNKNNKKVLVDINKKIFTYLLPISILFIIIFLIFQKFLVNLILGKQYVSYAYLLNYMLFISLFYALKAPAGYTLNAAGLQKKFFLSLGCAASVNVTLCLILIPAFGITGAAISCLVSEFVDFSLLNYFFWKYIYRYR
jgi:O-antigen/teichoic acid export membrane protein